MYFVRNWLFLLHSGMEILTTKHMPSKWTVLVQNGGQSSVIVSNRVRTWPPSCCILVKGYIWCQKKQKYVMFICMATTHEIFTKPYLEIAMYAAKWLAQRRWQIEVLALISSIVQIVLCSLYWVFLQIKSIVNVQIVIFFFTYTVTSCSTVILRKSWYYFYVRSSSYVQMYVEGLDIHF